MEKIVPAHCQFEERIGPVFVYLDDLNFILEKMNGCFKSIYISDDEYIYSSLDELREQKGNEIDNIRIVGKSDNNEFCSVVFCNQCKKEVVIRADYQNSLVELVCIKICALLKKRSRKLRFIYNPIISIVSYGILVILLNHLLNINVTISVLISWLVICPTALYFLFNTKSLIILNNKHQYQSFWIKYKDDFAKHAITVIITVILTTTITWVIQKTLKGNTDKSESGSVSQVSNNGNITTTTLRSRR